MGPKKGIGTNERSLYDSEDPQDGEQFSVERNHTHISKENPEEHHDAALVTYKNGQYEETEKHHLKD